MTHNTYVLSLQHTADSFNPANQTYLPLIQKYGSSSILNDGRPLYYSGADRMPSLNTGVFSTSIKMSGYVYDLVQLGRQMGTHAVDQVYETITWDHKLSLSTAPPNNLVSIYEEMSGGTTAIRNSFQKCLPSRFDFALNKSDFMTGDIEFICGKRSSSAALSASPILYASPESTFTTSPGFTMNGATIKWNSNTITNIESLLVTAAYPNPQKVYVHKSTDPRQIHIYRGTGLWTVVCSINCGLDDAYHSGLIDDAYDDTPTAHDLDMVFARDGGGANKGLAFELTNCYVSGPTSVFHTTEASDAKATFTIIATGFNAYTRNAAVADGFYA